MVELRRRAAESGRSDRGLASVSSCPRSSGRGRPRERRLTSLPLGMPARRRGRGDHRPSLWQTTSAGGPPVSLPARHERHLGEASQGPARRRPSSVDLVRRGVADEEIHLSVLVGGRSCGPPVIEGLHERDARAGRSALESAGFATPSWRGPRRAHPDRGLAAWPGRGSGRTDRRCARAVIDTPNGRTARSSSLRLVTRSSAGRRLGRVPRRMRFRTRPASTRSRARTRARRSSIPRRVAAARVSRSSCCWYWLSGSSKSSATASGGRVGGVVAQDVRPACLEGV